MPIRGRGCPASLGRRRQRPWSRRRGPRIRRSDGRRQRREEEQLELEAEPSGGGTIGIERGDTAGDVGQGGGGQRRTAVAAAESGDDELPKTDDELVGEGRQIAAIRLEPVEDGDAVEGPLGGHGLEEGVHLPLVRHAQQVAHAVGRDGIDPGAEELVEHRLRIAHATRGQIRHERDGVVVGSAAVLLEDAPQLALDLLDGQRSERESLQARDHRRPDLGGVRGAEDEEHVIGRLLERLEEDIPALLDALHFVDDEDLAAQVRGRRVDARHELAHVVDLVVRGGVHLDHVEGPAVADRLAGGTRVTRFAIDDVGAVDGLGQDARHRGLARAARPDEEEAVRQPVEADRVPEGLDHRALADDLIEALGAPAPIERHVTGCRRWGRRGCRGHGGKCSPRAREGCRPADAGRHPAVGGSANRGWFAVHPPSTEDVHAPAVAIGSDQAGPRHPAISA